MTRTSRVNQPTPTPIPPSSIAPAPASSAINGQADTAEALAILKLIKDLSLRTWREHLKTDDQTFLFDMSDKASNQGAGLYVSQRQIERLRGIRSKLVQAGVL